MTDYHIIRLGNNGQKYTNEGVEQWWKEYSEIRD